ncbi:MAG: DUF2892 domain-containing protein [Acholeplasmataceae bacterium]
MKKNVGRVDKMVRYGLAIVFLVVGAILYDNLMVLSIILFVLALIMVVTSAMSFCGLYRLFGINTCEVEPKE